MQAKLLLALEKRTIRPIGATDERPINVHIIAATNRDIQDAINKNEFRSDLFHRLRVFEIHVIPLRQRPEDILPIAETFIQKHAKRFSKPAPVLSLDAATALKRFHWPGNVRELSHTLESAILTCDQGELCEKHLRLDVMATPSGQFSSHGRFAVEMDFENGTPTFEQTELQIIRAAFEYSGRNLRKTARILGLSREAIRYRLAKADAKLATE